MSASCFWNLEYKLGSGTLAASIYAFLVAPMFRSRQEQLAIQKDEFTMSDIGNVISLKLRKEK